MIFLAYKAVAAFVIFFVSMLAVIYPLKTQGKALHAESLELGEAFASGIFLGVAFFHMLPHSIHIFQTFNGSIAYPIPEAICVGGFLLLLFLERLSFASSTFSPQYTVPAVLVIILLIHALMEGTALGIGKSVTESLMIFIAIIAHKGSASFALCVTLMRYQFTFRRILIIVTIFALMPAIGIGLGTTISLFTHSTGGKITEATFDAFAAGTFLYMSTLHHIRFHQRTEKAQGMLEFGCLALGLAIMGLIALVST